MNLDFAARVEIGKRETNDDRALIGGYILDMNSHRGTTGLPAVAAILDGCGGYKGGGIAAHTVAEYLSYEDAETLENENYLSQVLEHCKDVVYEKQAEMPNFSEMCTTIAGCVFCRNSVIIFSSGDSRVYRCDRWGIARMTTDHSVVQKMIDMGEITPEEALVHPKRNVITRCIGIDGLPPEIYVSRTPIQPGEKYLLCSDGLWESVSDNEIKNVLHSDLPLQEMVDTLIDMALSNGADDNISICICAGEGKLEIIEKKPFILE